MLRGVRTADDNDEHNEEYLRSGWTVTSQWQLTARLDAERGALVDDAIRQLARAHGGTIADALVRMAEIALVAVRDGDAKGKRLRGDELAAIVVHVDAETYPGEQVRSAEPTNQARAVTAAGRIRNGPGLPRRVIERLACAGRVRTIVQDQDGSPLDLGRSHRLVSDRMFRALLERDGGCVHPGCRSRDELQAHHVRPWLLGGPTNMKNLVLLCANHHHALHDDAFRIESRGRGRWRFLRADGRELLAVVNPADYADASAPIERDFHTDPWAPRSHWDGQRLDRHYAVGVIAERRAQAG